MKNGKVAREIRQVATQRCLALQERSGNRACGAKPRRTNPLFLLAHLSQWEPFPVRVS